MCYFWIGMGLLIYDFNCFRTKIQKLYFWDRKGLFRTKVKLISIRLKEVPLVCTSLLSLLVNWKINLIYITHITCNVLLVMMWQAIQLFIYLFIRFVYSSTLTIHNSQFRGCIHSPFKKFQYLTVSSSSSSPKIFSRSEMSTMRSFSLVNGGFTLASDSSGFDSSE